MKKVVILLIVVIFLACNFSNKSNQDDMYIVQTEVKVKPGTVPEVLELFETTNPALVSGQEDWVKASFSVYEEENIMVVRAYWKKKSSYQAFSKSEEFKEVMSQFGKYFVEKPQVTISKILFEM